MASMANATRQERINRIEKYEEDLKRLKEDIANQKAVNEKLMADWSKPKMKALSTTLSIRLHCY